MKQNLDNSQKPSDEAQSGVSVGSIPLVRRKRKYWYDITVLECVLCGCGDESRKRKYGRKPSARKRHHYKQFACCDHFA